MEALRSRGFQWNAGGWFGGQIGCTLWLVLLGVVLLARGEGTGALVIALAATANAVGLLLWSRRDRIAPYRAFQILLATCGLVTALALLCFQRSTLEMSNGVWWVLLIYPTLSLQMYLQERAARRAADEGGTAGSS